ncbi:cytochrome P450 [Streptomyces sp. BHT-5-2]|uniref:cytochrome P450 n=1 Tax=Streptomyces sp. BHT-5-2 TaxID=2866715 RepID=UPI001C8F0B4C|nr:cytochrome P450 [Streptomyces sp. BHT-5-2]QZL06417.1 cytochrome P450 [Streptomyces sp. BHT-5-2]
MTDHDEVTVAAGGAAQPAVRRFPFNVPPQLTAPAPDTYADLRENDPVHRVELPYGGQAWLVTRYADVRTVLADPRFSRTAASRPEAPRFEPVPPPPVGVFVSDPPEHTRLRSLVATAFTRRRVEALRPGVRASVQALITRMEEAGPPTDLVTDFALPLPVAVICDLFGVPEGDRTRFRQWCDALLSTTSMTEEQIHSSRGQLFGYLSSLVAQRRRDPADDLLSGLVKAQVEDDRLTEEELVVFSGGLLVAGYETSASQLANFTCLLLRDPERWKKLSAGAEQVETVVEELLRYVPSLDIGGFTRVATEDIELSGVLVRAGETVVPVLGSANRDASVFAEPHHLDLTRATNPHIAFGYGPHRCIGAQLARVELQEAFTALPGAFPGLRIEAEPRWKTGTIMHGLASLPVSW